MTFKRSTLLVALALAAPSAYADTIAGVYFGADYQFADVKGSFGNVGAQENFAFGKENLGSLSLKIEHPIPLIPNIRVQYNNLTATGETVLDKTFVFQGQQFTVASRVGQDVDLTNYDATFYYEILDNNLVSLDVGVTAKYIDGELSVFNDTQSARKAISTFIPMAYGYTSIGLLGTDLAVFAEGNYVKYDGSSLSDYKVGVSYELIDVFAFDLQLQAGFKRSLLVLDDIDDLDADLNFKGAFLGLQLHF